MECNSVLFDMQRWGTSGTVVKACEAVKKSHVPPDPREGSKKIIYPPGGGVPNILIGGCLLKTCFGMVMAKYC